MLIAGTADESVDPAVSENAATASGSENVTSELIEGADHIYAVLTEDQTMADSVIDMTADRYAANLQAREADRAVASTGLVFGRGVASARSGLDGGARAGAR